MGFWAAAVRADGLIYGPDFSPLMPDDPSELATIENAKRSLGGETWAAVVLTEEQAQVILGNLPGRCWWIGGEIVAREAPTLTLNRVLIDTLQHQTVTASVDVHATDTNYITWRLMYPDGRVIEGQRDLVEGLADFTLSPPPIVGTYSLDIVSIECGSARVEFEAVEMRPTPEVQAQLDNYHRGFILRRTPKPSLLDERITPLWQQI